MHLSLIENEILRLRLEHAMLYIVKGQDVFDLTESLGMESV